MSSLFAGKPKSKKIAKIISIESPTAFKQSIKTLKKGGLTLHERRALQLAENRAGAMLKKKDLSKKERKQLSKIKGMKF